MGAARDSSRALPFVSSMTARSASQKLVGVYYVQGFERECALDYAGVAAGDSFPELTNGDNEDGQHQEDFFGFWLREPWDDYLRRARAVMPALRVLFVELSETLPFGRKVPDEPLPVWVDNAASWGTSIIDGVELGIDVLEPVARSRLHELLFTRPMAELAGFRERLNGNGLFSTFEDAAEFTEAALALSLYNKPQATWSAHRIYWLRSLPRVTVPLWVPPAEPPQD